MRTRHELEIDFLHAVDRLVKAYARTGSGSVEYVRARRDVAKSAAALEAGDEVFITSANDGGRRG